MPLFSLSGSLGPTLPASTVAPALASLPNNVPPIPAPLPAPRTAPLVLSSALPPIPAKAVEKIQGGGFIDFKELLVDNSMLLQRLQELGISNQNLPVHQSRLREVQDPLTWLSCYLMFMATRIAHPETRDMVAYGLIVTHLVRKHGGRGWLSYDSLFRQQVAAGTALPWTELNSSLMAATVLQNGSSLVGGFSGGQSCTLCLSSDHVRSSCALFALEPTKGAATQQNAESRRPRPYRMSDANGICHRFNRGTCQSSQCRYDHVCSGCFAPGHNQLQCPRNKIRPAAANTKPK